MGQFYSALYVFVLHTDLDHLLAIWFCRILDHWELIIFVMLLCSNTNCLLLNILKLNFFIITISCKIHQKWTVMQPHFNISHIARSSYHLPNVCVWSWVKRQWLYKHMIIGRVSTHVCEYSYFELFYISQLYTMCSPVFVH